MDVVWIPRYARHTPVAAALALMALGCVGSTAIDRHARAARVLDTAGAEATALAEQVTAQVAAGCSLNAGSDEITEECLDEAFLEGRRAITAAAIYDRAVTSYAVGVLEARGDDGVDVGGLLDRVLGAYRETRAALQAWAGVDLPGVPDFVLELVGGGE